MEGWREGGSSGEREGREAKRGIVLPVVTRRLSFLLSAGDTSDAQPTPRAPLPNQRRFVALRCGTQSHENASVPESEHLLPRAGGPVHGSPARRLRDRVQHPGKRALRHAMRFCIAIN